MVMALSPRCPRDISLPGTGSNQGFCLWHLCCDPSCVPVLLPHRADTFFSLPLLFLELLNRYPPFTLLGGRYSVNENRLTVDTGSLIVSCVKNSLKKLLIIVDLNIRSAVFAKPGSAPSSQTEVRELSPKAHHTGLEPYNPYYKQ